jgi:hypothetical protein
MVENHKLPTLHEDGYVLISGVESHREAPNTFWIPSDREKTKVGRGSLVKLTVRPFLRRFSRSGAQPCIFNEFTP